MRWKKEKNQFLIFSRGSAQAHSFVYTLNKVSDTHFSSHSKKVNLPHVTVVIVLPPWREKGVEQSFTLGPQVTASGNEETGINAAEG